MSQVKRYLGALTAMLLLGALMAPSASADHSDAIKKDESKKDKINGPHESIPNIPIPQDAKAICTVTGAVAIDQGVEAGVANHNHFVFTELVTQISCTSANQHYNGTFFVDADGGTDGCMAVEMQPNEPPELPDVNMCVDPKNNDVFDPHAHGENTAQGWSHSNDYSCGSKWEGFPENTNKGDIFVEKTDLTQKSVHTCGSDITESWVKFVRGWDQAAGMNIRTQMGSDIIAWGHLAWSDPENKKNGDGDCFRADLEIAGVPEDKDGDPATVDPIITSGTITGTAVIYNIGDAVNAKDLAPVSVCDKPKKDASGTSSSSSGSGNGNGGGGSRGPQ